MGAERERLVFPISQTEQCSDADAAEAARVGALRAVEPPVEILFRAGGVQSLIDRAIVGSLIDDEPLRAVRDDLGVWLVLHRADLDGQRGNERLERIETVLEITFGNELRMLSGD